MKATFKNTPDEFSCEPVIPSASIDRIEVEMIDLSKGFPMEILILET